MEELSPSESLSFTVDQAAAGLRIDAVVHTVCPRFSRSAIKELFRIGAVSYNGHPVAASFKVREGSDINIVPPPSAEPERTAGPSAPPLKVLYQDDMLVVVEKPSGIPAHPLKAGESGTVLDGIVALAPDVATAGKTALEGGLLHRLDNDTSGILAAARTAPAWHILRAALERATAYKEYLAIVCGALEDNCIVDYLVAHSAEAAGRSVAIFPDGYTPPWGSSRVHSRPRGTPRKALSEVSVVERRGNFTLVRVRLAKAVTHQVRVHLAAIGHPIAGDDRYLPPAFREAGMAAVPRLALHATRLVFEHPLKEGIFTIDSPLSDDLAAAWDKIQKSPGGATGKVP